MQSDVSWARGIACGGGWAGSAYPPLLVVNLTQRRIYSSNGGFINRFDYSCTGREDDAPLVMTHKASGFHCCAGLM